MKALLLALVAVLALSACSPEKMGRIQVTTVGVIDAGREPFLSCTLPDLRLMLAGFGKQKTPVPLMFEHGNGLHGGVAAGWLRQCGIEPTGTWCSFEWTTYGRREACTGAWRYASGRFEGGMHFKQDQTLEDRFFHPTSLMEVSLTNIPLLDGMAPVPIPSCFALPFLPSFP